MVLKLNNLKKHASGALGSGLYLDEEMNNSWTRKDHFFLDIPRWEYIDGQLYSLSERFIIQAPCYKCEIN